MSISFSYDEKDLQAIKGVGPQTAKTVFQRAPDLRALSALPVDELVDDDKIAESVSKRIIEWAGKELANRYSTQSVGEQVAEVSPTEEDDLWVMRETRVDRFNTKRVRVQVTPAVCVECGADYKESEGLGDVPFGQLEQAIQDLLRRRVAQHRASVHTPNTRRLISGVALRRAQGGK